MAMSTGKVVALIQAMGGGADPAVIEAKVQDWLDAHPEATTTVQDGSITEQKLATSIAQKLGLISSLSDEIAETILVKPAGVNLFDVDTQAIVDPSNAQYMKADMPINITGDIVLSTDGRSNANYFTNFHAYNAQGQDLGASLGNIIYNTGATRSGKMATLPNGTARIAFDYRIAASGGPLIRNVMVTAGNTVPMAYEAYRRGVYLADSAYVTLQEYNNARPAYVSLTGNDNNDGLTFDTAVATFAKALTISHTVIAERGAYNQLIYLIGLNNVKLLAYNDETAYSHANPTVAKVEIQQGIYATNCYDVYCEDYIFNLTQSQSSGHVVTFEKCDNVHFVNCEANGSHGSMGFMFSNTNVILDRCYATENKFDGFNFHEYGTSVMNDCISENNLDDGCSHHDGCIGYINGGQFNGNGKCGIAPAYGANVNISNAVCSGNPAGIGYLSTNNGHASMKGTVNSCLLLNNTNGLEVGALCTVTAINCKYSGNTTDKVVTGTLAEY